MFTKRYVVDPRFQTRLAIGQHYAVTKVYISSRTNSYVIVMLNCSFSKFIYILLLYSDVVMSVNEITANCENCRMPHRR